MVVKDSVIQTKYACKNIKEVWRVLLALTELMFVGTSLEQQNSTHDEESHPA